MKGIIISIEPSEDGKGFEITAADGRGKYNCFVFKSDYETFPRGSCGVGSVLERAEISPRGDSVFHGDPFPSR